MLSNIKLFKYRGTIAFKIIRTDSLLLQTLLLTAALL